MSRCIRCDGLLVCEVIHSGADYIDALRCVNCGEILEEKIVKQRLLAAIGELPIESTPRIGEFAYWDHARTRYGLNVDDLIEDCRSQD